MHQALRVGWGQAEITPRGGAVSLYGQWELRITEEIRDPLYAVAMVIESAAERTIWVGCDLLYVYRELREEVCQRLSESLPGFQEKQLILSATHSHTVPNTSLNVFLQLLDNQQDDPRALSTDSCRAQVAAGIVKAISQAIESLEESRFEVGVSRVQTGVCRRALYKDGSAQMYGDVHREDFCGMESRDGGPMQMLYCRRLRDGKLTGIAANIPCTAQCDEMALYVTADYMGVVRERLGETLGADVKLLGLIRSAGDLSPHQMVDRIPGLPRCHGHEGAVELGTRIAEAIVDALRAPAYAIAPDAPHAQTMARVELPIWTVDEAQYQQAKEYLARLAAKEIPDDAVTHATALAAVKRYEYGQETYPVPLHAVRLGNVALLTNPFELYQEYADRMRMALKDVHVFDVQLADDALGYLPTQKAVDGGGYSAGLFSCLFGQQGGDALVRHSVALVESLF